LLPNLYGDFSNHALLLYLQLRKPVVEKMRRDRINSKFLNQQPDSKLEKADILEMTVSFLRRQQQQQQQQPAFSSRSAAVNQGFSRCVHELLHFLSKDEVKTQSQRKLMNHVLQNLQHPAVSKNSLEAVQLQMSSSDQQTIIFSKEENLVESALWRPW
uniref:Orange domain-containing protein n=1 Tax=Astyanax mexicanus TaxID=7994 RepID=A0A3B1JDM2_ASTMX